MANSESQARRLGRTILVRLIKEKSKVEISGDQFFDEFLGYNEAREAKKSVNVLTKELNRRLKEGEQAVKALKKLQKKEIV